MSDNYDYPEHLAEQIDTFKQATGINDEQLMAMAQETNITHANRAESLTKKLAYSKAFHGTETPPEDESLQALLSLKTLSEEEKQYFEDYESIKDAMADTELNIAAKEYLEIRTTNGLAHITSDEVIEAISNIKEEFGFNNEQLTRLLEGAHANTEKLLTNLLEIGDFIKDKAFEAFKLDSLDNLSIKGKPLLETLSENLDFSSSDKNSHEHNKVVVFEGVRSALLEQGETLSQEAYMLNDTQIDTILAKTTATKLELFSALLEAEENIKSTYEVNTLDELPIDKEIFSEALTDKLHKVYKKVKFDKHYDKYPEIQESVKDVISEAVANAIIEHTENLDTWQSRLQKEGETEKDTTQEPKEIQKSTSYRDTLKTERDTSDKGNQK